MHLTGGYLSPGQTQTAHVTLVHRREPKETVPFEPEAVFLCRCFASLRPGAKVGEGVEGAFLLLNLLFGREPFLPGVGPGCGFGIGKTETTIFDAGKETVEVGGLLGG